MIESLIYQAKNLRTIFVSDEKYLSKRFFKKLGYQPNFCEPKSFNEKVTARMIYERNTLHTALADKLAVRELIVEKIGSNHLVDSLGVYRLFKEIDFNTLPNQFVLKCNHDSGSAIVCLDKNKFDRNKAELKISHHLKENMYIKKREWHYRNIPPRILIEQYVELLKDQSSNLTITTSRVHCFEGQAKYIEVDIQDENGCEFSNIYDSTWELQPFTVDLKQNSPVALMKPEKFDEMLKLSEKLCFKQGYSRIDFLLTQNEVFFSEITLTPNAGRMVITPSEWDFKLGQLWTSKIV